MNRRSWIGVAVVVAGVAMVGWSFYDFATAPAEEGAPWGFFALPVGGVVAMIGFALINRSFAQTSSAFSDEELRRLRGKPPE